MTSRAFLSDTGPPFVDWRCATRAERREHGRRQDADRLPSPAFGRRRPAGRTARKRPNEEDDMAEPVPAGSDVSPARTSARTATTSCRSTPRRTCPRAGAAEMANTRRSEAATPPTTRIPTRREDRLLPLQRGVRAARPGRAGAPGRGRPGSTRSGSPTTTTRGTTRRATARSCGRSSARSPRRPSLPVTTGVTCPTVRIHPAIIAQAAATSGVMHEGRFQLGVG